MASRIYGPRAIRGIVLLLARSFRGGALKRAGALKARGPQNLEARGICHFCHMVNPALLVVQMIILTNITKVQKDRKETAKIYVIWALWP